jgi:hypothetical protein
MSDNINANRLYGTLKVSEVSKEPTGFDIPENVVVTGNGDRTITLTGTFNAYWQGVLNTTIISGWTSSAHGTDTSKIYYLYYDGSTVAWYDSLWTFDKLQICMAIYDASNTRWYYLREPHGLMNWQAHQEFHQTIGTYLTSGGDLSNYTLSSTTATNRRPQINATIIKDEDLPTTLPSLTTNSYTIRFLSSTNTVNYTLSATEIVPLSTNNPYYNQFTGGNWVQTLMSNNAYAAIFLVGIPVANSAISQAYRFQWIQPQTQSTTLSTIQALSPSSINWGNDASRSPEFVVFAKIIIRYSGGNWQLISVEKLTGTSATSVASSTGSFLSTVTTNSTILSGTGTLANPLTTVYQDGFVDYNDLTTQTTPLSYTTGELKITNDKAGTYTLTTYKPPIVVDANGLFNSTTNQFKFDELALGDEIMIRADILVTTSTNNQSFELNLKCDTTGTPYYINFGVWHIKTPAEQKVVAERHIYLGNTGTKNNPAELLFSSDNNASIKVNGFYISVKRRF